jgi:hypothetical protein
MRKTVLVYDQPVTLYSDDGRAWFSQRADLRAYRCRQMARAREIEALLNWLRSAPHSGLNSRSRL